MAGGFRLNNHSVTTKERAKRDVPLVLHTQTAVLRLPQMPGSTPEKMPLHGTADLTTRKINWGDGEDDAEGYFVMSNGRTIARIFPTTRPDLSKVWQWSILQAAAGDRWKEQACRGYELTREAAVEALARAWQGDKCTVVSAENTRRKAAHKT